MSAEARALAIQRKMKDLGITDEVEAEAVIIHDFRHEIEETLWES